MGDDATGNDYEYDASKKQQKDKYIYEENGVKLFYPKSDKMTFRDCYGAR